MQKNILLTSILLSMIVLAGCDSINNGLNATGEAIQDGLETAGDIASDAINGLEDAGEAAEDTLNETGQIIDEYISPNLQEYTVPEEIEHHTIDEAKVENSVHENPYSKAVLDETFMSKYINVEEFQILKTWVSEQIDLAKNKYDLSENEFKNMEAEVQKTYDVIANQDINIEEKKEQLYTMLNDIDEKVRLDFEEFKKIQTENSDTSNNKEEKIIPN